MCNGQASSACATFIPLVTTWEHQLEVPGELSHTAGLGQEPLGNEAKQKGSVGIVHWRKTDSCPEPAWPEDFSADKDVHSPQWLQSLRIDA